MSEASYSKQQATALGIQDPRQTEAYALVEIARRMDTARQNTESSRDDLVEAYQLNWRLWTIFQSELSNPENQLPNEIKINMLQLANFVDSHTLQQMKDPTLKGLDVLININRQVGAGLLGDQGIGLDDQQNTRLENIKTNADASAEATEKKAVEEKTLVSGDKPKFTSKKVK